MTLAPSRALPPPPLPAPPTPSPPKPRALLAFAGPDPAEQGSLASCLKRVGCEAEHVDLLTGVDLSAPEAQAEYERRVLGGEFSFLFLSPPCSSFCIALEPSLRSVFEPYGMESARLDWGVYLENHNEFYRLTARLARAAHSAGVPWLFEHPAARHSWPARSPIFEDRASAWDLPIIEALATELGAVKSHLAMCAYGSQYQKYTSIMGASTCELAMRDHLSRLCECRGPHAAIAKGADEFGASRSAPSAAYPQALNAAIAAVIASALALSQPQEIEAATRESRPPDSSSLTTSPSPPLNAAIAAAITSTLASSQLRSETVVESNGTRSHGDRIHLGSRRPHHLGGAAEGVLPEGWAHAGSLRSLEPELGACLAIEPLPSTNTLVESEYEPPPPLSPSPPPGPFTSEELLPEGVYEEVVTFGHRVRELIKRATRGTEGPRVAKHLRPVNRNFTEVEALQEAARGHRWHRQADGLWHAITPSTAADPPSTDIDIEHFVELARREHLIDQQLISWIEAGMPGAPNMPVFANLASPHVGALENAKIFVELAEKDSKAGFVTFGHEFPDVWPCNIDPMNVVIQGEKGRLTIDKSILSSGDPELPSFNLSINLEVDEEGKRYRLVRHWQFSRAAAILDTACVGLSGIQLKLAKLDWESYFRKHGKQRAHVHQSGRLLADGYGTDWRVNFGESNAPDHTGRSSNAVLFFIRRELARLEAAYPTRHPQLRAWLRYRLEVFEASAAPVEEFCGAMLFFVMAYVDDLGFAIIDDLLFDQRGEPLIIIEYGSDGVASRRQQSRAELYFDAAIRISEYVGHVAPMKKRAYPGRLMTLIGHGIDLDLWIRFLDAEKAVKYRKHTIEVLASKRLEFGQIQVKRKSANSLVHRLIHSSEVVPMGKAHVFYLLEAVRAPNRLKAEVAIIGAKAQRELSWWLGALEETKLRALPLASRFSFPTIDQSDGVLVHYGDASREYDEATGQAALTSGWGAWTVLGDTFFYIEGRWSNEECKHFSINVLESAVQNFGAFTFFDKAVELGLEISHIHTFTDNTSAENVSERGRTQSAGMDALNYARRMWLVGNSVYQRTSRVASEDNDIADLLSRFDVEEALRMAADCGFPKEKIVRLEVAPELRDLSSVPSTWA